MLSVFCRRPEEVSTQGGFSYILENEGERAGSCEDALMCSPKGDEKRFFTSEIGTVQSETLPASSGRNTQDSFTGA